MREPSRPESRATRSREHHIANTICDYVLAVLAGLCFAVMMVTVRYVVIWGW